MFAYRSSISGLERNLKGILLNHGLDSIFGWVEKGLVHGILFSPLLRKKSGTFPDRPTIRKGLCDAIEALVHVRHGRCVEPLVEDDFSG
jgi:hypothetical protein